MPRRGHDNVMYASNQWGSATAVDYTCGWCGREISSAYGVDAVEPANRGNAGSLRACPRCGYPSFVSGGLVVPAVSYGDPVAHLSDELSALYTEARDCVSISAVHAAVMVARKILMHIAVGNGAPEGKRFIDYVDHLVDKNLIPPGTKEWVDEIREVGNDANHEIKVISEEEAKAIVDFTAMLLKLLYEYPARGNASVAARAARDSVTPS